MKNDLYKIRRERSRPFPTHIIAACLLALLAAAPGTALAAGGDLITTFGINGVAISDPTSDWPSDTALDTSGIYIAGQDATSGNDFRWRMEKRDLTNGNPIWLQISNPTVGTAQEYPVAVAIDSSGLYVAGNDRSLGPYQWRTEKRNLGDGNLIWSKTNASGYSPSAVAIDNSGLYVVGSDPSSTDPKWFMEKRDLTNGNLIWSQTSNPAVGSINGESARVVAIDSSGLYVAGTYAPPGPTYWRIEKRNLTNGNLIWGINETSGSGAPVSVAIDSSGLYVTGTYDYLDATILGEWRTEKRNLTNGNLIWSQTSNPSSLNPSPRRVAIDSNGLYVVGDDYLSSDRQWRMEKRDPTNGNLIWSQSSNPSSGTESPRSIAIDSSGLYIGGYDVIPGNYEWRIEKRNLTDGNLIWSQTNNPSSTSFDDICCVNIDNSGLYITGKFYLDSTSITIWRIEKRESGGALPPPPPTVNLSAAPSTIISGNSSTLTWTSTDATSCAAVSPAGWTSSTATGGSQGVSPTSTTTYIISCTGAGGTTQQSTTVTVNPACTWTLTTVDLQSVLDVGFDSSIVIGMDGLPAISYLNSTSGDLKVAKCGNASCSSGNTLTTVDSADYIGYNSSIVIGADSLPVIAYHDSTNNDLKVAKCGNAGCTAGNTLTTVDSAGTVGFNPSIAIGTDGLPVVSYYDNANADLKVAKCGNVSCSSGNTITTVDSGQIGLDSSIAIGTDGLPVIAYSINIVSNALKVAKCGNASCSAGNTLTTVELTGAYYPSIVIGTDGFPVISYYDSTTDLKVAKCGNASCSSGNTITTVDSTGDVGSYTSIAKGTDGFPVIAYYDLTNYYLKAAKCGNASCSSGNTFTIVDSTGFVNYRTFPSIAISTDGEPVISYYDNTNTNLKVAKGNSCGGGGTPAPMVSLWADQTTIASGGSVTLTWASTNAASCAAVSPAGWTASTAINGSQLVTNITATTTYIISCTGAGGTTQQSATVTVSGGGGVACGQQIFDGTTAITIPCEDPPVSQLRVQKNGTTYGIGVVATTDPNASKIRIQTPSGVKALRKQ